MKEEGKNISRKTWQRPRDSTQGGYLRDTGQNNIAGTEGRSEVQALHRNVFRIKDGEQSWLEENVEGLEWFDNWYSHILLVD